MNVPPERLPDVELLLDVRTPAELSLSPDGSRIAFAVRAGALPRPADTEAKQRRGRKR